MLLSAFLVVIMHVFENCFLINIKLFCWKIKEIWNIARIMDKPPVYQGITLYNPNDYLDHQENDQNVNPHLLECLIPAKLSSTVVIVPRKKSRDSSFPQSYQKNEEQFSNNLSSIEIPSHAQLLDKDITRKTDDTTKKLPTLPPTTFNDVRPSSTKSSKVHFSASRTQMLPDEGFDYFDISLLDFPSTPLFGTYLSGYFQENETKEGSLLRLRASKKFGRKLLRPNYRLGKLPALLTKGVQQTPLFLFEAAYNSQLELRLAEIDEAMRGHPPEKKKRLDLNSSSSNHSRISKKSDKYRVHSRESKIPASSIATSHTKTCSSRDSRTKNEDKLDEIFKTSSGSFSDASEFHNFHNERSNAELSKDEESLSVTSSRKGGPVNKKESGESGTHSVSRRSRTPSKSSLVEQTSKEIHYFNSNPVESSSDYSSTSTSSSESDSDSENSDSSQQSVVEDLKKVETSQSLNSNICETPLDPSSRTVVTSYISEKNMNTNNNSQIGLSIEKKKASVLKTIFGIFMKKDGPSRRGKSENQFATLVNNTPK